MPEKEFLSISREVARAYVSDCGGLSSEYDTRYIKALRRHQMTHRDWTLIDETRAQLRHIWANFFTRYDIVLAPVSRTAAFEHDHTEANRPFYMPSKRTLAVNGVATPYDDNVFWSGIVNAALLPSTARTRAPPFPVVCAMRGMLRRRVLGVGHRLTMPGRARP